MKIKNKKPIFFISLVALLFVVGGTFAYYYTYTVIPNKFQSMTYNVTVREEFNNEWGTKKVFFVNEEETNTPIVLRINYNEKWRDKNGYIINNLINGTNVVNKVWTDAFTNDFVLGTDGWYYYKKVLNPHSEVQVLSSISLNTELVNSSSSPMDYLTGNYFLDFNYEAIQATPDAVNAIWNREITITGGDVNWGI